MKCWLTAAAILTIAAPAQADDVCDAVRSLTAAAPDRFSAYVGDNQGGGQFSATVRMPRMPYCIVIPTDAPILACRRGPAGEAVARTTYEKLAGDLLACLPDWRNRSSTGGENAVFASVDQLQLVKTVSGGEVSAMVALAKVEAPQHRQDRYEVSIAFTFKPTGPGV